MTPVELERYKRHILVKEIGGQGQHRLLSSRVTIIGAGALGGPLGLSLAAAGVGQLCIWDDDKVDVSNLQRQTQFVTADVGQPKAEVFTDRLRALNPSITVEPVIARWTPDVTRTDTHVVIDATDNFETRFSLNTWSRKHAIPLVSAAVAGWQGQAVLLNRPGAPDSPCYRCLVPETPETAGNCNDMGVVGPVAAMTSNQAALITLKLLIGLDAEYGRLWIMDGLKDRTRTISLPQDPQCPTCHPEISQISA